MPVDRPRQHLRVADHPVDAGLHRQPDNALPDRHLRRPHSGRLSPHEALEEALPQLDLALRVLAMREVALWKLKLWIGGPRRVDMAQKWKDRVVVRREGELSLAAVGELPIFGDHLLHDLH